MFEIWSSWCVAGYRRGVKENRQSISIRFGSSIPVAPISSASSYSFTNFPILQITVALCEVPSSYPTSDDSSYECIMHDYTGKYIGRIVA